jgi:hypothetical protein
VWRYGPASVGIRRLSFALRDIALITEVTARTMERTIHVLMCGNRFASGRRCRFVTVFDAFAQ